MSKKLDANEVRRMFDYDPLTGVMTRKITASSNALAGSPVGYVTSDGYLAAYVMGRQYKVHRLAWLHFYGEWPNGQIDHINRQKQDNSIKNLRVASASQNQRNKAISKANKSGVKGVFWNKKDRRWVAICRSDVRGQYIGSFQDQQAAIDAVRRFREQQHGAFARHD
jgi:hypothetical protein